MEVADEREAFLNAICDAPADDLPRLVFADWLDARGESDLFDGNQLRGRMRQQLLERFGNDVVQ